MTKSTTIYVLIDPRNQTRHYIGKTIQNPPQKRLRQHVLSPATENLAGWINELQEAGLKPELQILETVPPDADWRASEIYWIRYGLSQNWSLKNKASGGDNYPIELLLKAQPQDIIPRILYASEETLRLLTSINAYVMRGKNVEDNTFRDLLHESLVLVGADSTDSLLQDFCNRVLSDGIIQVGRGWRVPLIKKQNPAGGEFFTVGKPFTLNGISLPGKWDKAGWRCTIKMYKKTSELLDTRATEMRSDRRRGYNRVLKQTLGILETTFNRVVAM